MKKMLLIFSIVFLGVFSASALQQSNDLEKLEPVWQIEKQLESEGLFEGLLDNELNVADNFNDTHYRRPDRRRPGRDRYRHRNPRRHYRLVCYAENARRMMFRAVGYSPRATQRAAMSNCYRRSWRCYELGCRRMRRR